MLRGWVNTNKKKFSYFKDWKNESNRISNWFTAFLKSNSYCNDKVFQLTGHRVVEKVLLKVPTEAGILRFFVPYDMVNEGPMFISTGQRYIEFFKKFDPSFSVNEGLVVDIGGHVGSFCVPFAFQNPKLRVVVAEPSSANFKILKANIENNGLSDRFKMFFGAIYNRSGVIDFGSGKRSTVGAISELGSYKLNGERKSFFGTGERFEVDCLTLEKLLEGEKAAPPTLLKMDCEGSEYKIFQESQATIKQFKYLIVEAHPAKDGSPKELKKLIESMGYQVAENDLNNGCLEFSCKKLS